LLATRALTALLLATAFSLFLYFGGKQGLVLWCWLFSIATIIEFCVVMLNEPISFRILVFLLTLNIFLPSSFLDPIWTLSVGFLGLVSYVIAFPTTSPEARIRQLSFGFISLFYVGFLPRTVIVATTEFGHSFLLALFLVSFGTDTFAYFGGRFFGKYPLAPAISPKKTREGAIVGLIFGTLLSTSYFLWLQPFNPFITILLLGLASCSSQVGDIFESLLKRAIGKKDSSKILPGHGGILDRLDGLLFAAPIVYGLFSLP